MRPKITFILKGVFEGLPPMLLRLVYTAKKGIETNLICSKLNLATRKLLNEVGVICWETLHQDKFMGKPSRVKDWLGFRAACKKILKKEISDCNLIYICSADTALCLNTLIKKYDYILQSNELYDQIKLYRNGLEKYVKNAKAFIVPEYCRANICMYWYNLKKFPYVIPNIPYMRNFDKNQYINDEYARKIISKLSDKKIVLYQGHINTGDRSLTKIAEALRKIGDSKYVLVLMGRDYNGSVEKLKATYSETYYIPFIAAPYHLEVTSYAYIALLSYDRVSLNNLFCAPNKLYEYGGFGIPMLGNDIPGLHYTIEYEKMGVCVSYSEVNNIVEAIEQIEERYMEYSQNSKLFYKKNDLNKILNSLWKNIFGDNYFGE